MLLREAIQNSPKRIGAECQSVWIKNGKKTFYYDLKNLKVTLEAKGGTQPPPYIFLVSPGGNLRYEDDHFEFKWYTPVVTLASRNEIEDFCEIYGKEGYLNILDLCVESIWFFLNICEDVNEEAYKINWGEYLPKEYPLYKARWEDLGNMDIPALYEAETDSARARVLARVLFEISCYGTSEDGYNLETAKMREIGKTYEGQVNVLLKESGINYQSKEEKSFLKYTNDLIRLRTYCVAVKTTVMQLYKD